ncbi:MAG TPA: class I SAM-dependent methyltransferase [Mycobacterium sp.]|nr:class I SAM-dependent methyltransferase [Mycobacterium sp.]
MLMTKNRRVRIAAGTLETANLLFFKLLLHNRAAARLYPGLAFRQFVYLKQGERWRSGSIFDFMPELRTAPVRITLEHLPGEGLATPINELALMAIVTKALEPAHVFEIGTFRGRTALNFALNSPAGCQIFTLDLPKEALVEETVAAHANRADATLIEARRVGLDYDGKDVSSKITQLYGDSRTFDFEPYASRMDLVFVDGGHTYDVVTSDTEKALKMCRPGGIIMWHDFANYGDYHDVTRAVMDIVGGEIFQLEDSQLAAYRVPRR